MRVSIMGGWRTVSGPTGVRNAGKTGNPLGLHLALELGHTLRATGAAQLTVGMHGNPARIVAAVFEPFQALEQNRGNVTLRNRADNATHKQDSDKSLKLQ
jgi:hypothetical protein